MELKRTNCETCPYQLESHKEHIDYPVYYCIGKGQKNARAAQEKRQRGFSSRLVSPVSGAAEAQNLHTGRTETCRGPI